MKIVFFGTPDYVVPIAKKLVSSIVAVVTRAPKPIGRDQYLAYSPVDTWAHKRGLPIIRDLKTEKLPQADLGVLASFGEFIPKKIISHFPKGILVIHPSLLPKFRWSSPVPAAIVSGLTETGLSVFKMDEEFDHGPIVSYFKEEIKSDDTGSSLRDRLFFLSAEFLKLLIPNYFKGKINLKSQDHKEATFARMIKKEDGYVPSEYISAALEGMAPDDEWEIPFIEGHDHKPLFISPNSNSLERFIRAMSDWPGAWTNIRLDPKGLIKRLKILKSHIDSNSGYLVLDSVQLEGKTAVSWDEFKRGYPNFKFES